MHTLEENQRLEQMFQKADLTEKTTYDRREDSVEDTQFQNNMVEQSIKFENGHKKLLFPFRDGVILSNNKAQAPQRLNRLKTKLQKNPEFKEDYTALMEGVLSSGYAEKVPPDKLNPLDGRNPNDKDYGVTSYVRLQNAQGQVHQAHMLSKARVKTLVRKQLSHAMSMAAATVDVRLSNVTEREAGAASKYFHLH